MYAEHKSTMKTYRQGAVGALLDLYEHAISQLKKVIEDLPDHSLHAIINTETNDENCKSIQAILTHVVSAGYGYATSIHNLKGNYVHRPGKIFHSTIQEYTNDLAAVFTYTETVFRSITDNELEQPDEALKMKTSWGQVYDIEQLTEHAIVHILRHTRQIERIKQGGLQ